jgi:small-conductance mechanosensitive channel
MEALETIWHYRLVTLANGGEVTIGQIILAILLFVLGFLLAKLVQRLIGVQMRKAQANPDVIQTIQRVAFYIILILVFITALGSLNIPISALAFVSGAVAIGVGFGAQNIINNFISSWILMSEKPVRIGDFVEVDEHKGVVESIGNRSTRIKRVDGVQLLIPNSQMLERIVVNWTLVDFDIRTTIRVGVSYGSPVRRVEALIREAVEAQPEVLTRMPRLVIFEDFGDNALIFDTFFWCSAGGEKELRTIRSEIRYRIMDLFEKEGIVIAYPQRDIHLDTLKPLEIRMHREDSTPAPQPVKGGPASNA